MAKRVRQEVVVSSEGNLDENKRYSNIQLFNEDGTPFSGGSSPQPIEGYTGDVIVDTNTLSFEDGILKTVTPV